MTAPRPERSSKELTRLAIGDSPCECEHERGRHMPNCTVFECDCMKFTIAVSKTYATIPEALASLRKFKGVGDRYVKKGKDGLYYSTSIRHGAKIEATAWKGIRTNDIGNIIKRLNVMLLAVKATHKAALVSRDQHTAHSRDLARGKGKTKISIDDALEAAVDYQEGRISGLESAIELLNSGRW